MYLADLKPLEAVFFHTPSTNDNSWTTVIWKDGKPLNPQHPTPSEACRTSGFKPVIEKKLVEHGLWAHTVYFDSFLPPISIIGPTSYISYKLEKKYKQLSGAVGVSESAVGFNTTIVFCIICDGTLMWRSQPIQEIGRMDNFQMLIMNCDILELVAVSLATFNSCQAIWVDPILI